MSLRLSVLGLSVSLFATSVLGSFVRPAAVMASKTVEEPKVATVLNMTHNDTACYVTLVDEKGIKYEDIPAVFSVCKKEETLLNKKVSLAYNQVPITDCPNATDCGTTKLFTFITQIWLQPING